ncbi:unnamed protein product [Toxocara canis]|uniref:Tyrosine-protein phosphatase domain-containing protein n=1 Tax=Toxocara canis TaxID=6265 RepID=A0A183UE83_TOXCA|nr:unnamed protein product [Toxocara canis]
MTRGRLECSVENEGRGRYSAKKGAERWKMTKDGKTVCTRRVSHEPRAPIGTKFVHKSAVSKSSLSNIFGLEETLLEMFDNTSSAVAKLNGAEQWLQTIDELGVRGIRKQFIHDVKGYNPGGAQNAWEAEKNVDKNRFEDIQLLDKTRVILKNTPDKNDYIHASYVQIYPGITYICAQGPMTTTIEQFWIMIVQEQSKVILQLCRYTENGKEQCAEYFPTEKDSKDYGSVHVHMLEKSTNIISLKKVARAKIEVTYAGTKVEVLHILYSGWPDHFVADSPAVCREVRTLVNKHYDGKPVIIHCSAGVGRLHPHRLLIST